MINDQIMKYSVVRLLRNKSHNTQPFGGQDLEKLKFSDYSVSNI